jgi:RNA polymerase sigma-70 factor (ECF subfamily)
VNQGASLLSVRSKVAVVRPLPNRRVWTDSEIVALLRTGVPEGRAVFFDHFAPRISKLVWSVLGPEPEAEDVLHEIFVRALERIDTLTDAERLGSWIAGIAVFTSREWLRRRTRWRWLRILTDDTDAPAPAVNHEVSEALRAAFEVLHKMDADERVVFSLRFMEGMELQEIALACDTSLSTVKRRLKDAQTHFARRAQKHPSLLPWLERQEARARAGKEEPWSET